MSNKRFSITVDAGEDSRFLFDPGQCGDMPDAVAKYLEELGNQLAEEGGEGTLELPGDYIPEEVDAYFRQKVTERMEEAGKDLNSVKISEYPPNRTGRIFDRAIDRGVETALEHAETEDDRAEVAMMSVYLKGAYRMLFYENKDWGALGMNDAAVLFDAAAVTMLLMASKYSVLTEGIVQKSEKEEDSDDGEAE